MLLRRIVLTGGPGAGKTTIATGLLRSHPPLFVVVPEAATQVFRQLGTRWSQLDAEGRRDVQRRIYQLQRRQEQELADTDPDATWLLDRGTVDGAAYWPGGCDDYWPNMGTTLDAELARYDAVLHLQTCAVLGVYDGARSNEVRHEDRQAAVRCDEALGALWRRHPRYRHIAACRPFGDKARAVRQALVEWGVIGPEA